MSETLKEEFLLEKAKSGDQDAFNVLYERHRGAIFRFLYRLLGSAELAEDITHDCFLSLIRESESSRLLAMTSVRTRLYSNARNLAMKYLRNSDRQPVVKDVLENDAISRREKPNNETRSGSLVSRVGHAVASLPPLERETLILAEYEGLELNEIAVIIDADCETVASRLESARQRIRIVLANHR